MNGKAVWEARSVIAVFPISCENYEHAVKILHAQVGDKQDVIDLHYSAVINITPACNTTDSLRSFLNNVDRTMRCLEALLQQL